MKYRVAAVNYTNTLPFLYGFSLPAIRDLVDVYVVPPSDCADMMIRGDVDIALCPVGAFPALENPRLLTDYCIGCDGAVRTVSIFSNAPLHKLGYVVLSPESRTSNLLVQIMELVFWKFGLKFGSNIPDINPEQIGYLQIGDKCFEMEKQFQYQTDLGAEWKRATGLPFVFACWTSLGNPEMGFVSALNDAFREGISQIDHLVHGDESAKAMLRWYLRKHISFQFDDGKKAALEYFLELLSQYQKHGQICEESFPTGMKIA